MTYTRSEPRDLLSVMEAARRLHVSDDTLRRQIRSGDLPAIQIGTTPTGRPRYRIPVRAVEERLGQVTPPSAMERLRAAFAELTDEQKENLIAEAVQWARSGAGEAQAARQPALTPAQKAQPENFTLLLSGLKCNSFLPSSIWKN